MATISRLNVRQLSSGEYFSEIENVVVDGIRSAKGEYVGEVQIATVVQQGFKKIVCYMPHGKGLLTYDQTNKTQSYEGDWYKGKQHGKGIMIWKNGNSYEGDFVANCLKGKGIFKYPDGIYEGEWKANKKDGKGVLKSLDGRVIYDGEWKANKRHGQGYAFFLQDNTFYEGRWNEGKRHGRGITKRVDGEIIYKGFFRKDQPSSTIESVKDQRASCAACSLVVGLFILAIGGSAGGGGGLASCLDDTTCTDDCDNKTCIALSSVALAVGGIALLILKGLCIASIYSSRKNRINPSANIKPNTRIGENTALINSAV